MHEVLCATHSPVYCAYERASDTAHVGMISFLARIER
jgi:hypothetical protein